MTIGSKTFAATTPDNITNTKTTVLTYDTKNISTSDWGDSKVTVPVNSGDQQYYDTRFGTASNGGKLELAIGSDSSSPSDATNDLTIMAKNTTLLKAEEGGHVVWSSRNRVYYGITTQQSPGDITRSFNISTPEYAGTFSITWRDRTSSSFTVTDLESLKDYNNALIDALDTGKLNSQKDYDSAFGKSFTLVAKQYQYTTTINEGDDTTLPSGERWSMVASGQGAVAEVAQSGQIDQRTTGVLAEKGGSVVVNGKLSGIMNALVVRDQGSYAVNNGVISGGYYTEDNYDTFNGLGNVGGSQYAESQNVTISNSASFENNGIINVSGWTYAKDRGNDNYGIDVSNARAVNGKEGVINIGVNNNAILGSISGARLNGDATFVNDGEIFIGRSAQYSKSDIAQDTTNTIKQYGIKVNGSNNNLFNNGEINFGSKAQNATGVDIDNTNDSNVILGKDSVININGDPTEISATNIGIRANNTNKTIITNSGLINVSGSNSIGVKVIAAGDNTSNVNMTDSSIININGEKNQNTGTRSFGVWVEGNGDNKASSSISGEINLNGDGAIGIYAKNNALLTVNEHATPNFSSGSNQVGFFIFGPQAKINTTSAKMDVSTEDSTLFRLAGGAVLKSSGLSITSSGTNSVGIKAIDKGTVIDARNTNFNLIGEGSNAVTVLGGAYGLIDNSTEINLLAKKSVAGIVDGKSYDLDNKAEGMPISDTFLESSGTLRSAQPEIIGYIVKNDGTLNLSGDIYLDGENSKGIYSQGGVSTITNSVINVNGDAVTQDGMASKVEFNSVNASEKITC